MHSSPVDRRVWGGVLAGGLLLLVVSGWPTQDALRSPRSKEATSPILPGSGPLLVLTGNEKGFIRPCGCSKPKLGGVHRRATALNRLRETEPGLVALSGGDLVTGGGRQQRMKFETFLMSLGIMGYRALAIGHGELQLGLDYLVEMRGFASFPLLCLNLTRDGERPFEGATFLEDHGVWVVGLLDGRESPGLTIESPVTALKTWLAETPADARAVVFFSGSREAAALVAASIPAERRSRLAVVFGGAFDAPFHVADGPGFLMSLGSKGRDLALVRIGDAFQFTSQRLEEAIPEDPDLSAVLDGYRQSLGAEKLVELFPKKPNEIAYVGEAACVECHEDTCKKLDATPHESAWQSLVATQDHHDPECVACHVVGFGDQGGFVSEATTPHLLQVACEACHGPGELHVQTQAKTPGGKIERTFCVRCHDPDNSPQFDFDRYWPKIAHPPK